MERSPKPLPAGKGAGRGRRALAAREADKRVGPDGEKRKAARREEIWLVEFQL